MRNVGITIGGITFLIFMIKMGVDPDNKARYINIVKTLSLREKEVLFYLYKKQKTINEISKIMKIDRTTIWRIRNKAQKKIAEKLVKGEN